MLTLTLLTSLLGCGEKLTPMELLELQCADADTPEEMAPCFDIAQEALGRPRPDIKRARKFLSKACQVHHPASCNVLAEIVRDARGGPPDVKRAAELFSIACKGELASACVNLGVFYYKGEGVKQDAEKAVELFTSACDADPFEPLACHRLGYAHLEGEGVEKKDEEIAEEFQLKACSADYAEGCKAVADMAMKKQGPRRSGDEYKERAAEFYEKACVIDNKVGCFELATLHKEGDAPDATDEKAAIYFQKTCNADPTRGCYEAAALMEEGKVSAREGEIEQLYHRACEHGHTLSCSKRNIDLEEKKEE